MERQSLPLHGRGTGANPTNRFETIEYDRDEDAEPDDGPGPRTTFYKDTSRSLITTNDSPDVPFDASINVYRGCEHGCIYCYARPFHEYLGLSAGLDFESKIFVKEDAPNLLRRELDSPRWKPKTLAMSGVTDCYQPIERRLHLTRRCLEVMVEFRQAVAIVTKNRLVVRDADLLGKLSVHGAASVRIGVTSLDPGLANIMEPRATTPAARLEAIRELAAAGVPVGVMVAPIIPGLNDHEAPAILEAARSAGAMEANYTILRLPFGVKDLFVGWVEERFPTRASKILGRIRDMRDGKLNESEFGKRMRGSGPIADVIDQVFRNHRRRLGFPGLAPLSTAAFRRPAEMPLFAGED
jgi:DNA repair photolyase